MFISQPFLCALVLGSVVAAVDVDINDVPSQCRQICDPVASLTASCDRKNQDDTQELDCICKDSKAPTSIPLCEACIAQNSRDGHDNDANDLVRSCSFSTTSYNPTSSVTATATATTNRVTGTSTSPSTTTTSGSAADVTSQSTLGLVGSALISLFALLGV
ncbi:uncharacterized protein ATNIH1004_003737 [Aspergillus tanneri]|uniref:Extracellular membrane protein CFEM domain-containing protein n=1 Tax=Aspergillus tanneri TaxID=1220188 RepID=A0A5M9N0D9_9EURO|nr:uncharacterized protein ATNIH1004_003737 [Aspergillus tanneri]KAA8651044.1 hypothetical protein ATNIH1004_003737 [Aspergillus tanneri]